MAETTPTDFSRKVQRHLQKLQRERDPEYRARVLAEAQARAAKVQAQQPEPTPAERQEREIAHLKRQTGTTPERAGLSAAQAKLCREFILFAGERAFKGATVLEAQNYMYLGKGNDGNVTWSVQGYKIGQCAVETEVLSPIDFDSGEGGGGGHRIGWDMNRYPVFLCEDVRLRVIDPYAEIKRMHSIFDTELWGMRGGGQSNLEISGLETTLMGHAMRIEGEA